MHLLPHLPRVIARATGCVAFMLAAVRTAFGTGRPVRPMIRRSVVLVATVLGAAALASPASAGLALTGPMDPLLGFPAWYQDVNGTRMQLCVNDPGCPISPPVLEPVAPNDEAFYSLVSGTATGPAGQGATMDFAIEAAFLDTPVSFGRVQVTMNG